MSAALPTVLITLPMHFCVRNFLYTPVVDEMAKRPDVKFVLASIKPAERAAVEALGLPNVEHAYLAQKRGMEITRRASRLGRIRRTLVSWESKYLFPALTFRFNFLNGFACLHRRLEMSAEQQQRETAFSNFSSTKMGWPFPGSRRLYRVLFALRSWLSRRYLDPWVEDLFDSHKPDALVLSRLQLSEHVMAFIAAAHRRRIPVLGIVQSWDQPTTKGPVPAGVNAYVVGSRTMQQNLARYHGIPAARIMNLGQPFYDDTIRPRVRASRTDLLRMLGLPPARRIVLVATNNLTVKAHEPSIIRHLAARVAQGAYGSDISIVVRTHPQDMTWTDDFKPLHRPPEIVVTRASGFGYYPDDPNADPGADVRCYWDLLTQADVVINTASSVALDAAAMDRPVILIGFDGDQTPAAGDRVMVRYTWEHLQPILASGGGWLVQDFAALDQAVCAYLANPRMHAEGRQRLREEHVAPQDGRASERLVATMTAFARGELSEETRRPFWRHAGIGTRE